MSRPARVSAQCVCETFTRCAVCGCQVVCVLRAAHAAAATQVIVLAYPWHAPASRARDMTCVRYAVVISRGPMQNATEKLSANGDGDMLAGKGGEWPGGAGMGQIDMAW